MDIKQTLLDFHNTLKTNPEISDDELLNKFPQIGKDNLSAAFDYSATIDSGKYKTEDEFVDKFPEFFPVKKKEEPVDGGTTLPEVVVTASKQSTPPSSPTSVSASASAQSPLPLEGEPVVTDEIKQRYKRVGEGTGILNSIIDNKRKADPTFAPKASELIRSAYELNQQNKGAERTSLLYDFFTKNSDLQTNKNTRESFISSAYAGVYNSQTPELTKEYENSEFKGVLTGRQFNGLKSLSYGKQDEYTSAIQKLNDPETSDAEKEAVKLELDVIGAEIDQDAAATMINQNKDIATAVGLFNKAKEEKALAQERLRQIDYENPYTTRAFSNIVTNAIDRGTKVGETADILNVTAENSGINVERLAELQKLQQDAKATKLYEEFSNNPSFELFKKNPIGILLELSLESMSALYSHGASRMAAGAGTGATLGSVVPGVGTAAGASSGVLAGLGMASLNLEYSGKIMEGLANLGVDVTDATSLKNAFADEKLMTKLKEDGLKKGVPVALFDMLSGGIAGKVMSKPAKSIVGKAVAGATEMAIQAGLGGAGEATGQLVSEGKISSPNAIVMEMIGEAGPGSVEVTTGTMIETYKRGKEASTKDVVTLVTKGNPAQINNNIDANVASGNITQEQGAKLKTKISQTQADIKKVPEDLSDAAKAEAIDLIKKKDALVQQSKNLDPAFKPEADKQIKDLESQILGVVEKDRSAKVTELPEVTVKAGKRLFNEPNPETKVIATEYKQAKGIDTPEGAPITKLDENKSKSIADAYDAMENNPNDPEVKAAYEAMAKETKDQFDAITKAGVKFEIYEGQGEPYKNSEEMIKDVRDNKHLFVLSTEKDFGQNPITDQQRNDNPLLRDSGAKDINGKPLLMNDVFRGVHDFFGHTERGNSFGAVGEENAWDVHARMFTPLARRAMTTETRGQNSWVNFGKQMRNPDGSIKKKGDPGYLSPTERAFAEQKIGLLPEEYSNIEDNYTKKSPQFTVTASAPVDLPNVTVKSPIHKKVIADINQAAKSLEDTGIKFKIYDNADSFATESGQDKSTQGVFVDEDGTVSINLAAIKNSKDWNIAWHESSHPVMNIIRNTNRPLYDKMAKGLSDLAKSNKAAAAIVGWSENNYEGKETQVDEAVVESIALMADGTIDFDSVPLGTRQAIIDFINEIAKYLGLDPILSDTSKATFIKKAKEISNALKTGTNISEVVGKENVKEFKNNIGENVGEPTQLKVRDLSEEPVQFKESYPLSFVKPEDKIDIKSLIDEIQTKGQKVWFWVADQLGRGNYYDSVIDGEHYLDAGPSFALDPENRKQNIIWATGKGEKFINDNIKKSDYLFIISGSPSKSKLFNKKVADITIQRLKGIFKDDYAKFKAKMNSVSKITGLNNIINEFNSFEELLDSPKRKDFLIAIDDQKEKKGTDLKKFLDENKLFVDYESLRDGFYKDNGFDMNDIMLVLKPTKMGGVSKHSTYQNNVLGDVVGVPDKKINAYDIMTPEFRAKYPELKSRTQQSQTVAPYGSGIKGVASPIKETVVGLPDVTVTSTKKQQKVGKVELPAATQKQMTEDDKGNYLFYHYSDKNIKTIDPNKFGSNTRATGRDERPGVGISMYYTRPDVKEQNVPNDYGYVVRVPKAKVYPFNQDPLNLIEPARRMFEKQYPGQAFDPNKQVAWVSKAAAGRGYPMTVAEWNIGRRKLVRAQTTEALKPEKYSNIVPGTLNQVQTNPELEKFKPNAKKRSQAKIGGGLSLEDLKEFNKLPNIDLASGNNYVPLSKFGITSVEGENVKTISEKLAEFEGPFQPIFKAISKFPNADKVKMYDLGQMENTYNSAGGQVAGLYHSSKGLFGKPKIGIATGIYANQYSTVAHEMMHWVTLESINKYKSTPEYKSLENIYNFLKAKHPDIVGSKASGSYYGLQNFNEFMAELLTNKEFRDNMSGVMAKDAKEFEKTSYANKTKDIGNNADLISLLIDYVTRTIKDMMDSWGKSSGNIDFSKPIIDNATDLAVKAYFAEPLTGKPLAQRRAGGLSLEDLKEFNNLPNIEMLGDKRIKLSDYGINLADDKHTLKSASEILSKIETPLKPLFNAIANMPKSENVRLYNMANRVNQITGGGVGGQYVSQWLFDKPQLGVVSAGNEYFTLAHEAMHWVTLGSLNKQKGTPEYKALQQIYNYVKAKKQDRIKSLGFNNFKNYGLANFEEFMAEILVDPEFRNGIADVMAENKKEFSESIYNYNKKNSGDLITTLVNYIQKVLRDYFDTWGKGIDFNKSMLDNATDLAIKAYFAGPQTGKPRAQKREGGLSLEDLKEFNNLPNIEMAYKGTRVKLSDLGVDLSKKKYNLKTISTELSKVEGPYQPLFKALANMPKSEKVYVYDFAGKENPITGGLSAGIYTGAWLLGSGTIGVRSVGNEYAVLAHEAMHWVTWDSINKKKGTPEYKALYDVYEYISAKKSDVLKREGYGGKNYGLAEFSEFMAELLVNKDFRDGISDIVAENKKEFSDTIYEYNQKEAKEIGAFISVLINYVRKVIKDYFDTWGKGIDFNKSMLDNATDLAVKAYFAGVPSGGAQLSTGSANVDADTRKSVANMLDKLSDEDIAQILMDEKGLTEDEAMEVIEDVKYDPSLNPSVANIVGEVGEGERARGLSKTFPDRGSDTIAKINSDAKKYFVVSNKQTAAEAQAFIDDKNPEDALDYLLTQPTDIPNRVRIWMSGAVMDKIDTAINEAQLKGDKETAQRLSDKQAQLVNQVAPLGTELGQAIQAFRRFYENSKGSPSMLQFYIKKITDQVESEKGKPLTDEERQTIVDLAKNVQSADEGLPKDEAVYALGNYISSITPVAATDIMEAIWYAHILSGITTQSTNFFANLWNSFAEGAVVGTREAIKTKSVMPFINGIQGFLSGIKQGANDAADILKTGVSKQDGDKFKQGNILEFFSWKQVVGDKVGKVLDWAPGYSPKVLKYVGRALAATDAAFSRANSEAISRVMAYNIAKEEGKENPDMNIRKRVDELLNKTAEKKAEAKEKAKAEGYLEGTTRYRRRVGEILEEGRSKELKKEADEFGKRVTLNYEPEGFMRPVYKLALALQQSTKLTRMFIPFTRIVVNLTENSLNYTPLGFVKAAVGSTTTDVTPRKMIRRKLSPDERADFAIKATIGLSTFVLLSGLTGEDDDDLFEITANGSGNKQKNYELMKSGWRPYSIKTKDGKYISYKDWPIAPILAAVGAMHDAGKYNSSDEPTNEATIAAQAMVISLYDKSVMKGLQDFVEIIDPKEEYNQSTKMFDRLKNWGADQARTMAVSNFTQQAFKFASEAMDNPIKASKGVERIYRDIPYLNDGLNPILDVFGEPVKPSTSERLLPITLGKPSKDEVLAALNENGVYIGKPKTRDLYVSSDIKNEETRPMTDQEYYQFTKRSGQITKEIIMEDWDEIKKILTITDKKKRRADLKAYMSNIIEAARKEAFYEFPNQD